MANTPETPGIEPRSTPMTRPPSIHKGICQLAIIDKASKRLGIISMLRSLSEKDSRGQSEFQEKGKYHIYDQRYQHPAQEHPHKLPCSQGKAECTEGQERG